MKILLFTPLFTLFLLLAGGAAAAEPDPRLQRLEAAYNRLHLEQQAAYQQFQMAQELLRNAQYDDSAGNPRYGGAIGIETGRIIDYDENIRQQRQREERRERYRRDVDQAYARYLELGERKKALLDQMAQPAPPAR